MTQIIVCPKCKKDTLTIICPEGKEKILHCESCTYKRTLPDDEKSRRLWEVQLAINSLLASMFCGNFDVDSLKTYRNQRFLEILEE